ncbi:MAG TPA: hypothetical protein VNN73_02895 [Blastocatellia bacterium]|nr:hypothetical protein [Blastocatellia bacterium]
MCQESALIVTGVVESSSWVVHPDKMETTSTPLPNGNVRLKLPNPVEFVVGSIYRVNVEEVIKKYGKIKVGSQISVFIPGFMTTEQPSLVEKKSYLLFLSPLEADSEQFAGTIVYKPSEPFRNTARFNPQSGYGIVQGQNGAIHISSDNIRVIDDVKAAMKKDN